MMLQIGWWNKEIRGTKGEKQTAKKKVIRHSFNIHITQEFYEMGTEKIKSRKKTTVKPQN